jgi:ribosomal protein S18 acetylase RimI-like enzyme
MDDYDVVCVKASDDTYYRDVKSLFSQVFPQFERSDMIKSWEWRDKKYSTLIYSKKHKRIIAFILVQLDGPSNLYVSYMAVHPDERGIGIGVILMKCILKLAYNERKAVRLIPLTRVRKFYEKLGFYRTGKNHAYNFHWYNTRCAVKAAHGSKPPHSRS